MQTKTWEHGLSEVRRERAAIAERVRSNDEIREQLRKLAKATKDYSAKLDALEPWVRKPFRGQDFWNIKVPVKRAAVAK